MRPEPGYQRSSKLGSGGELKPDMHLNNRIAQKKKETRERRNNADSASCRSYKGRRVDALASRAEEGRGTLRKAPASRVQAPEPGISEWGNPRGGQAHAPPGEHIVWRGERGELKHLSTPRKREDFPSSGERKGRSPNRLSVAQAGLQDPQQGSEKLVEADWKAARHRVKAP